MGNGVVRRRRARAEALRALALLRDHDWPTRASPRFCRRRPFFAAAGGLGRASSSHEELTNLPTLPLPPRWPAALRALVEAARALSPPTKLWKILPSIDGSCSRCNTRNMGPKKRHECFGWRASRAVADTLRAGRFGLGSGLSVACAGLPPRALSSASRRARRTPPARRRAPSACSPRCVPAATPPPPLTCEPCDSADETDVAEADGEGAAVHVASVPTARAAAASSVRWRLPSTRAARRCSTRCGRRCGSGGRARRPARVRRPVARRCCAASLRALPTMTRWPASSASAAATTACGALPLSSTLRDATRGGGRRRRRCCRRRCSASRRATSPCRRSDGGRRRTHRSRRHGSVAAAPVALRTRATDPAARPGELAHGCHATATSARRPPTSPASRRTRRWRSSGSASSRPTRAPRRSGRRTHHERRLAAFVALRGVLALVVERLLLLDRALYVQGGGRRRARRALPLFSPVDSPRNTAVNGASPRDSV